MMYQLIAENPESTVVGEYAPQYGGAQQYQSEAELEASFIKNLCAQGYEYLSITSSEELIGNLRKQLEKLNDIEFSPSEWNSFFHGTLANKRSGIQEKTELLQVDSSAQLLTRDDGTTKNIYLIDKENIHNNSLQVINQYATDSGTRANRYDVTILVNGLPSVHIELKRRGVDIKEAFNQIRRYQRESFWADSGLFEYVQLFVISNGTYTKYYSNTTRLSHIKEQGGARSQSSRKTSHSYEFTSWWTDAKNTPITELRDFTRTFLTKHSLLSILSKYCVYTVDKILLVMRPYQIVATERILTRIAISQTYKTYGKLSAGGYVWHTTGSGKTLTSFKTAQLASKLPYIDKVLFVVDRKDLDYQTMKEYDKFAKGAANSNTSTAKLKSQLENPNCSIIITTIQKLSVFIKKEKEKKHPVFKERVVLIFDECHRSQFGDMHKAITKHFKQYNLFGFTGTPIFAINSQMSGNPELKTTAQAFGEKLHTYTIINAIADQNVLPFRIDYVSTMREQEQIDDKAVYNIDTERALASPERISNITRYILEHFDHKTKRASKAYDFKQLINVEEVASDKQRGRVEELREKVKLRGFNSLFAVASIDFAKLYYSEFKRQMAMLPEARQLKVAIIYSFGANEAVNEEGGFEDENTESTAGLDESSRDFLEAAIRDYNKTFGTSFDSSAEKFQNYYKDVSLRLKNRQLDLLIVVNMFLTGFDATTLNTLWVDKNLRMHGLLQAYSRTNRILNSIKTFGNIVCFRNLEEATKASIALFGDKEAAGVVLLKSYKDYMQGYEEKGKQVRGYVELVEELLRLFPLGERILSEEAQKEFIRLYGAILKLRNILQTFDEFERDDVLSERQLQDYHSVYIELYQKYRPQAGEKENINEDVVFEMELIKQVDINIDYILTLIKLYHESHLQDKEIKVTISRTIDSSVDLRNKKELIERFIDSLTPSSEVDEAWQQYIAEQRRAALDTIIEEERLKKEATYSFVENAFRDGFIPTSGEAITEIIPPVSRFAAAGQARVEKKAAVLAKLQEFFDRFWSTTSDMNMNER